MDVNDEEPHAANVQLVPELEVMHKEVPVREEHHQNTEFHHKLADYSAIRHAAYKLGCFEAAVAALEDALEGALASGISPAPPLRQALSQLVHIAADKVKQIGAPAKEAADKFKHIATDKVKHIAAEGIRPGRPHTTNSFGKK